jgi:N-acetylglucosaminyldiphosphoundecaprenol N-acetyl-beta-D-mannosaminyltransferase
MLSTVPDFDRRVFAILGLPFDAIDEVEATRQLREAVAAKRRCFLSTPNLNFAIACRTDPEFRQSVLVSDLCIADGWPIVRAAQRIGAPIRTRVAGSDLFERLRTSTLKPPLKVFFFGGPPDGAHRAHDALSNADMGLRSVGFNEAGFGDVASMSTSAVHDQINHAAPDLLVVSLGAAKGQRWIMQNMAHLQVPVISHLGAVVNFVAGTVVRAHVWVQRVNGEWLWRIMQERTLFARYWRDGRQFVSLSLRDLLPLSRALRRHAPTPNAIAAAKVEVEKHEDGSMLILAGPWCDANSGLLRESLKQVVERGGSVSVNLAQVTYLDSAIIGLLMLLHGWTTTRGQTGIVVEPSELARLILDKSNAGYLLRTQ